MIFFLIFLIFLQCSYFQTIILFLSFVVRFRIYKCMPVSVKCNVESSFCMQRRLAEVQVHLFLTSALNEGEHSASKPVRFSRGKTVTAFTDYRSGGSQKRPNALENRNILLLLRIESLLVSPPFKGPQIHSQY